MTGKSIARRTLARIAITLAVLGVGYACVVLASRHNFHSAYDEAKAGYFDEWVRLNRAASLSELLGDSKYVHLHLVDGLVSDDHGEHCTCVVAITDRTHLHPASLQRLREHWESGRIPDSSREDVLAWLGED